MANFYVSNRSSQDLKNLLLNLRKVLQQKLSNTTNNCFYCLNSSNFYTIKEMCSW